jgi:uridine kinase
MIKPLMIGICGPSTAGKSTLTKSLAKEFNATIIEADNFLFKKPRREVANYVSWEHPKSLLLSELKKSIKLLKAGKETIVPSKKLTEKFDKRIIPKKIVIVEGFLLFYNRSFANLFDLKIFIDLPFEKVIQRRVDYCGEEERDYSEKVVIPEHLLYRKKMIYNSDFILDGNKKKNQLKKEASLLIKDRLRTTLKR